MLIRSGNNHRGGVSVPERTLRLEGLTNLECLPQVTLYEEPFPLGWE